MVTQVICSNSSYRSFTKITIIRVNLTCSALSKLEQDLHISIKMCESCNTTCFFKNAANIYKIKVAMNFQMITYLDYSDGVIKQAQACNRNDHHCQSNCVSVTCTASAPKHASTHAYHTVKKTCFYNDIHFYDDPQKQQLLSDKLFFHNKVLTTKAVTIHSNNDSKRQTYSTLKSTNQKYNL